MSRTQGTFRLLLTGAAGLGSAPLCSAAGGGLWELGDEVDKNPVTVFSMFTLTVVLTIIVEVTKHYVEHRTADPHRRLALGAIYAELMMVGIVSFCLILGAELGLTEITITKPGCNSSERGASDTGSAASSMGAGSIGGALTGSAASSAAGSSAAADAGSGAAGSAFGSGEAPDPTPNASGSAAPTASLAPTISPAPPATCAPCQCASSGSSGSDPCVIGFDLLMFEYAHLVLFWMGITYCVFIQITFWQRDRFVKQIAGFQLESTLFDYYQKTETGWKGFSVRGIMGIGQTDKWARGILVTRAALVLQHFEAMVEACDPTEDMLRLKLAEYRREKAVPLPKPDECHAHFDIARFIKIALSTVLIELIHVPPTVWICIIVMSTTNVFHGFLDVDLAYVTLLSALIGPLTALVLLERMSAHLKLVCGNAVGHTDLFKYEYVHAQGSRAPPGFRLPAPDALLKPGEEWAEKGGSHPWAELDGCCDDDSKLNVCDPLDPGALTFQMQVIIFASCFYVGTIMMLTTLVVDHVGIFVCIVCWILPFIPLVWLIPRSILIFALVHRGAHPEREWIQYACKAKDEPAGGHGHGHNHGHRSDHGHGHDDKEKRETRVRCLRELHEYLGGLPCVADGDESVAHIEKSTFPPLSPPGAVNLGSVCSAGSLRAESVRSAPYVECRELDVAFDNSSGRRPSRTGDTRDPPSLTPQHAPAADWADPAEWDYAGRCADGPAGGAADRDHVGGSERERARPALYAASGPEPDYAGTPEERGDGAPLLPRAGALASSPRPPSRWTRTRPRPMEDVVAAHVGAPITRGLPSSGTPSQGPSSGTPSHQAAPVPCCPGCGGQRLLPDTPGAVICQDCRQRMVAPPRFRSGAADKHRTYRRGSAQDNPLWKGGSPLSPALDSRPALRGQTLQRRQARWQQGSHPAAGEVSPPNRARAAPSPFSAFAHCAACGSPHTVPQKDGALLCQQCGAIA